MPAGGKSTSRVGAALISLGLRANVLDERSRNDAQGNLAINAAEREVVDL